MSMTPQDFHSKLQQAAVIYNIALINRRTNDPENYRKAINEYEQALDLYIDCHDFYNYNAKLEMFDEFQSQSSPPMIINLELKIAQTLQSIARLYSQLGDSDSAVRANEDAITMLLEWKQNCLVESDVSSSSSDYGGITGLASPTGVMVDFPGTPESIKKNSSSCNVQVISLTNHERTRIISRSLTALAQLYYSKELSDPEYNLEEDEDALRYYKEGLNFLKSIENPISTTRILALSNGKTTQLKNAILGISSPELLDDINGESDAQQTPSMSSTFAIDLRKDIVSTLLSMASVYKRRKEYHEVVSMYEQARDVRLLLNSDNKDQEMIESLLALAYEKNKDLEKALTCYQHVLKLRKLMFGEMSLQVGNIYASLSNLHRRMDDHAQSLGWNKRAITIYTKLYEDSKTENPNGKGQNYNVQRHLIGSLQNQGGLYVQMNEIETSISTYLMVVEHQVNFLGEDHPDVARTLNVLGDLYMAKKRYSEARASFNRVLKLYKRYGVGDDDPDMVSTIQCLCEIEGIICKEGKKVSPRTTQKKQHKKSAPPKSVDAPTNALPFRPPVNKRKKNFSADEEDSSDFFHIVETNPTFNSDDDEVSQITFITNAPDSRSIAGESYQTIEKNLNDWSPAEYVFRAVDKLANATEELAIGLFSTPNNAKASDRSNRQSKQQGSLKRVEQKWKARRQKQSELECVDEGYEVREFQSSPVPTALTNSLYPSNFYNGEEEPTKASEPTPIYKNADSNPKAQNFDSEVSVAYTEATGSLLGTNFVGDASVAASTLYGTQFLGDSSVAASFLGGASSPQRSTQVESDNKPYAEREQKDSTETSGDVNIDEMLAQMNVVTCENDGAKPFEEILKCDSGNADSSKKKKNKSFEKISACLGTLDDLMDKYSPTHGKVLQTKLTLAGLYLENGYHEKGVKKYEEVLDLQRKKFGRKSSQVAETLVKLGKYYVKNNLISEGIHKYIEAKNIDSYLFGSKHHKVARHLNNIALAELEQNNFDSAMTLLHDALKIQQHHLAPNEINPDVALTYVHMGKVYYKERNCLENIRSSNDSYKNFIESGMLGKIAFAHSERGEYIEAIQFYAEVLEMQQNTKVSAQQVASTHNSLGYFNVRVGRYSDALQHHTSALKVIESSLDTNELDICNTNCDIGIVEYHLGNFKKASNLLESACSRQRKILGSNHHLVAKTIYHLAVIKRQLYELGPAMSLLNDALKVQLSTIGQNHPDTISTQLEIAKVLMETDEIEEALTQLEHVFKVQKDLLGNEHPDLASTLHWVALCHARLDDENRAMNYFEKCYRMQRKVLNFDCPDVAATKSEIGILLLRQGKIDKAFHAFQDALRIRHELTEDHFQTGYSLYHLALYYTVKQKYTDAIECFDKALEVGVETFGSEHPFIADIHNGIGTVNARNCKFDAAKKAFSRALKIYEKCRVNPQNYRVIRCKNDLDRVQREETLCV